MEFSQGELNELAEKFEFKLIVLYGSAITDQMTDDSDIDLGVFLNERKALENYQDMIFLAKLENELSKIFTGKVREIDISILNFASPLLKFKVAQSGKAIYERDSGIFRNFQVRAMKEHQDARKFYDLEKDYIRSFLKGDRKDDRRKINPPEVK